MYGSQTIFKDMFKELVGQNSRNDDHLAYSFHQQIII